jgi:hypothetical protein
MRFLLFIIILTIVYFVAGLAVALWVGVTTLAARLLFDLAGLLLSDRPGWLRSILVRVPVFVVGLLGLIIIYTHVGQAAVFGLLAMLILGVADSRPRQKPAAA